MKASMICTDKEQSAIVAEVLSPHTADMYWNTLYETDCPKVNVPYKPLSSACAPAWSLATLLQRLPRTNEEGTHTLALVISDPDFPFEWLIGYQNEDGDWEYPTYAHNPVEACVTLMKTLSQIGAMRQEIDNRKYGTK